MRRVRLALWPAGIVLGLGAEWASWEGDLALAAADLAAGLALLFGGLVAWERRPESRAGLLMALTGVAWFLGNFADWALYWHRGPLVHLLLSYPRGRLSSRVALAIVAAAYVDGAVPPLARLDPVTIALAAAVVAAALRRFLYSSGPERRARASALVASMAVSLVVALGAVGRLAGGDADRTVLWAYDVVVFLVALGLVADLLWGRWTQSAVTGLVVDLGETREAAPLGQKLARALGDPTLEVGYWLPERQAYVDEAGRPFTLPAADSSRAVTRVEQNSEPLAVFVHDPVLLGDRELVNAVAAAARLAVANVRLQAEVRARVAEVAASRRRIVEAADAQRRRLEQELREGAELRLERVAQLVVGSDEDLERRLEAARVDLRELARGIHPAVLIEQGLAAALAELADRSPVPMELTATSDRLPTAVEAAAYFVCSEALANIAKYARASSAAVRVAAANGVLRVEVEDDGVGGADPSSGSGLRGLADRVEALGGQLAVESPRGSGTRIVAELPLDR